MTDETFCPPSDGRRETWARLSLALGVISLLTILVPVGRILGLPVALAATFLGIRSLRSKRRNLAVAGIALSTPWLLVALLISIELIHGGGMIGLKPVIYLYPGTTTTVNVRVTLDGQVIKTTPPVDALSGSWTVVAHPDGQLTEPADGRTYPYLFWEGRGPFPDDVSTGFAVARQDVVPFLKDKLAEQGLQRSEAAEFIRFWAPRMQAHPYDVVHFEGPAYERMARLSIRPAPDTAIRVFMTFRGLDHRAEVAAQKLPVPPPRRGFVVVEWGGTELPAE